MVKGGSTTFKTSLMLEGHEISPWMTGISRTARAVKVNQRGTPLNAAHIGKTRGRKSIRGARHASTQLHTSKKVSCRLQSMCNYHRGIGQKQGHSSLCRFENDLEHSEPSASLSLLVNGPNHLDLSALRLQSPQGACHVNEPKHQSPQKLLNLCQWCPRMAKAARNYMAYPTPS